jgi:LEA14-like dessication related protein
MALVLGGSFSVGGLNKTIHESRLAAFLTDNVPSALDRLPEEFRDVLSYVTKEVQRPQATLANIGVIEASPTRVKLRVDVSLTNPNAFRGTVQRAEYRLLWDRGGQQLLLGETKEVELHRLKTKGTTEFSVTPLVLEQAQTPIVGEFGRQLLAGSSVPVTAQGRLTIAFRSETVEVALQGTKLAQRAKEG